MSPAIAPLWPRPSRTAEARFTLYIAGEAVFCSAPLGDFCARRFRGPLAVRASPLHARSHRTILCLAPPGPEAGRERPGIISQVWLGLRAMDSRWSRRESEPRHDLAHLNLVEGVALPASTPAILIGR